jgi:DNA-binding beta-propeller fold protein YncE
LNLHLRAGSPRELRREAALDAPLQPGNVAATADGLVGAIGVRGLALEIYDARTLRSAGRTDAGEGPTHLVAGPDGRFYVADTRGGAVLAYEARPEPGRVASAPLPGGYPYGIAMDAEREELWVTLTAENALVRFDVSGAAAPREEGRYPTVRQPNTVAVNPETGRVYVAGRDGEIQIIDP